MSKSIFQLVGTVTIHEERRPEFDAFVQQLQEKCGGDVSEQTLENCIAVLKEAYSETVCCLMWGEQVCPVDDYGELIQNALGIELSLPNRGRLWDMLLLLKQNKEYRGIPVLDVWKKCPLAYTEAIPEQLMAILCVNEDTVLAPDSPLLTSEFKKELLGWGNYDMRSSCLYQTFRQLQDTGEIASGKFQEELKHLLQADLPKRQELAEREDEIGMIAEASLYVLPAIIVKKYTQVLQTEFWDTWFSLGIEGYTDVFGIVDKEDELL